MVRQTAFVSILMQFLLGAVTSSSFVFIDESDDDLSIILWLEVSSQIVEFLWYLIVLTQTRTISTRYRYIDWVISTPIMLTSLGMFFRYRAGDGVLTVFDMSPIYVSLVLNWFMLLIGFSIESPNTSELQRLIGVGFGGIALVGSFTTLSTYIQPGDLTSNILFWVTFFVWSLYGVAASLEYTPKNVMYNLIDVVSKNGYGVFLFVYTLASVR